MYNARRIDKRDVISYTAPLPGTRSHDADRRRVTRNGATTTTSPTRCRSSSPPKVREAVAELFAALYPSSSFDAVWLAFHDFERLFRGRDPGYHGVDTTYHDIQHTLDMTLALARLVAGYEMQRRDSDRLGPQRAEVAIVSALFHDAGYLRHKVRDAAAVNGAVFTRVHVYAQRSISSRLPAAASGSSEFDARCRAHRALHRLRAEPRPRSSSRSRRTASAATCSARRTSSRSSPTVAISRNAATACIPSSSSAASRSTSVRRGAQCSTRPRTTCLRRRCRSTSDRRGSGSRATSIACTGTWKRSSSDGQSPYVRFIRKNLLFLADLSRGADWSKLRRHPPCVMPDPEGEARLIELALQRVRDWSARQSGTHPQPPAPSAASHPPPPAPSAASASAAAECQCPLKLGTGSPSQKANSTSQAELAKRR